MCKRVEMPDDTRRLRCALGTYPTGVAIVTARTDEGKSIGMTINSFTSISLSPALVAWSVDRSAASYLQFSRATAFTITVLEESQLALARRFASRGEDKFRDIPDPGGNCPVAIPGGCATFQCHTYQRVLLGDHLMLVGEVRHYEAFEKRPLLFAAGEFHQLPEVAVQAA